MKLRLFPAYSMVVLKLFLNRFVPDTPPVSAARSISQRPAPLKAKNAKSYQQPLLRNNHCFLKV